MSEKLLLKIESNIGKAKHLKLKSGKTIPAGIRIVDIKNQTVKFLHGQGLAALQKAQQEKKPEDVVLKNEANYTTLSINEIEDIS
jgi:hypothetical protein